MKTYVCTVCGFRHEGDNPPDFCEVCGSPASKFIELIDEASLEEREQKIRWRPQ